MRKLLLVAALAALGLSAVFVSSAAQAQGYGMMGGYYGYGPGYMMGPGYGHGYMMGPGYGYGYGPGMNGYAYAPRGAYGRGGPYRGDRLCWTSTDHDRGYGYYAPCQK
ncbi:MAG TPA: hypothetical protein VG986_05680 [Pseudolabrys sp.]|nr:hypothetical protein [Pseudolabrys sp.]